MGGRGGAGVGVGVPSFEGVGSDGSTGKIDPGSDPSAGEGNRPVRGEGRASWGGPGHRGPDVYKKVSTGGPDLPGPRTQAKEGEEEKERTPPAPSLLVPGLSERGNIRETAVIPGEESSGLSSATQPSVSSRPFPVDTPGETEHRRVEQGQKRFRSGYGT